MAEKLKSNEFRCTACKGIFEKGWSEEEAQKEADEIWGEIPEDEKVIICDDCFNSVSLETTKAMALLWRAGR